MTESQSAADRAATVERDRLLFGTTFTYDGQPLDPIKVVMYRTAEDGTATEIEEYDEWRLTGNPGHGYPPYDFTGHEPIDIAKVRALWTKVQSGEFGWTDAKLTMRHVTITRTEWTEPE